MQTEIELSNAAIDLAAARQAMEIEQDLTDLARVQGLHCAGFSFCSWCGFWVSRSGVKIHRPQGALAWALPRLFRGTAE